MQSLNEVWLDRACVREDQSGSSVEDRWEGLLRKRPFQLSGQEIRTNPKAENDCRNYAEWSSMAITPPKYYI